MPDILSDFMKIDPQVLRQLRDERSWTQEQLAAVSGRSLRPVQRIEREGNASAESRLALAGAFGVDVSILAERAVAYPGKPADIASAMPSVPAPEIANPWNSFLRHLVIYLMVGSYLLYRDLSANHAILWAYWPLMGWGIGVALHGWKTWSWSHRTIASKSESRTRSIGERYGVFLIMSVVFVIIDVATSGRLTWAYYPIAGWGFGLLMAATRTKRPLKA